MALPLKTVVVIDDDVDIQRALEIDLRALGLECAGIASDGRSGLELVRRVKPQMALVDVRMPGIDGLEAAAEIAKLGTTAVVILTANLTRGVARRAMENGASACLPKPISPPDLGVVLESAWHHFQMEQSLREETRQLNAALTLRKLVEKAKGILMEQQGFSEEEAHKVLQKMSQDQGISLEDVCRSVIQVKMVLGTRAKAASKKPAA